MLERFKRTIDSIISGPFFFLPNKEGYNLRYIYTADYNHTARQLLGKINGE